MSKVSNFFTGIINAVPVIVRKVGTFILLIFGLGTLFGFYLGAFDRNPLFLLAPFAAMVVMWYDLDEGFLLFLLLLLLALFL